MRRFTSFIITIASILAFALPVNAASNLRIPVVLVPSQAWDGAKYIDLVTNTMNIPIEALQNMQSSFSGGVTTVSANATIDSSYNYIEVDSTSGNIILTMNPIAKFPLNKVIVVKKVDATANTVTISAATDLISGSATQVISTQNSIYYMSSNGTTWTGNAVTGVIGSGNAATANKWTTARLLAGNSVDGSANVAFPNKFLVQGTADSGLSGAQFMGALGTGIVKNTTTTGVQSIAVAGDFPTLNQNTTGNAATVTTNANLTGPITSVGNATSIASQTGTGSTFVVNTSPTLVTPVLGVATATTINKLTFTQPLTGSTLTLADGKTLTANNSLTLAGTDATTITFQGTDTYLGRATTDILTNKTYDTAGAGNVFKINGTQISAVTGTGSAVLATSPTLITPTLGVATATTVNKLTFTQPATGSTLTLADGKTLTANNTLTLAGVDGKTLTFNKTMSWTAADDTGVYTFPTGTATLLGNGLTSANIFVGNVSNVATGVTMSGDATISNAGALTIGAGAVTRAKMTADGSNKDIEAYPATIATTGTTSIYVIAPETGSLLNIDFSGVDALAANDTNYITFAITNLGQAGAGSTAMLAATAVNTTKATGGSALSLNTKRTLTNNGTLVNMDVTVGDRLKIDAVATGTLANTVTFPVYCLRFSPIVN